MTWYAYRQNNSGGVFLAPAIFIVVEADEGAAFETAQANGLDLGAPSCECCGERWSTYCEAYETKPPLGGPGVQNLLGEYADSSMYKGRGVPRAIYVHASGEVEVAP